MRAPTTLSASEREPVSDPSRFCICCDCSCRMRRSAIICCCSLLAASAGVVAANATARTRTATETLLVMVGSLCGDDEMRPAVLRECGFIVARIEWEFLAVADVAQPIGGDSKRDQVGR